MDRPINAKLAINSICLVGIQAKLVMKNLDMKGGEKRMKKEKVRSVRKLGQLVQLAAGIGRPLAWKGKLAVICVSLFCLTFSLSHFLTFPAYAAGPEISITGDDWDFGGLLPGETAATSGDHWVISGSSDGTEKITVRVASTGSWSADANGGNGTNLFGLREDDASGKIIKSSDVPLIWLRPNSTDGLDLWFKAPNELSEYGDHALTVTLTVAEWVPGSVDPCVDLYGGVNYGGYCWIWPDGCGETCNTICAAYGGCVQAGLTWCDTHAKQDAILEHFAGASNMSGNYLRNYNTSPVIKNNRGCYQVSGWQHHYSSSGTGTCGGNTWPDNYQNRSRRACPCNIPTN